MAPYKCPHCGSTPHRQEADGFPRGKILAPLLVLVLAVSLAGCGSDMPYNGDVEFHELTLTIPDGFIRDSTQSSEDLWIFEKSFYDQYIILSRQDIAKDAEASLDSYAAYLREQGADAQRETFLQHSAVVSVYTRDDMFSQEMLVAYNGSFYAIALRGGTEEEFQALLETVATGR